MAAPRIIHQPPYPVGYDTITEQQIPIYSAGDNEYIETPGGLAGSFPFSDPRFDPTPKNLTLGGLEGIGGGFLGGNNLGIDMSTLSSKFDDFDENSRKEMEILNTNRVKLTEYVHDCAVLHPYMKQKNVFTKHDCELIMHEVTTAQRMDKFIDIVLTKGPKAIGVFHEALGKDYPYVFDVLTRLFTANGIELPESRQLKEAEDSETNEPPSELERSVMSDGCKRRKPTIRHTIRKHIDELTDRCEAIKNQRDELQKALLQRERDINALLTHRDQQIQQKYEDMLSLLANWRETITHQSDGSLEKMEELLTEQENIRESYDTLEADYMLVVSELSAARDRIFKLLTHLEKKETEFSLAQEKKEELNDKLLAKDGEIQRLIRKYERVHKDPNDISISSEKEDPRRSLEERRDCEERVKVVQIERIQAMEERDTLQLQLHEEKQKRKKLEKELRRLIAVTPSYSRTVSEPPLYGSERQTLSPCVHEEPYSGKVLPLQERTVFIPADDPGMTIGLAVVVRELTETGNAAKNGVWLGDEIHQINQIKLSSSSNSDPLSFAQTILQQVSQTVTLSIKRQGTSTPPPSLPPPPSSQPNHLMLSAHTSLSPSLTTPVSQVDVDSLYWDMQKRISTGRPPARSRPPNLKPLISNISSSTSNSVTRDTSDDLSEDSRDLNDDNYYFVHSDTEAFTGISNQSQQDGIIASPKASFNRDYKFYDPIGNQASIRTQATVTGMIIPEPRPSLSVPDGEDYGSEGTKENSNFTRYDSDSTDAPLSLEDPPQSQRKLRPRRAIKIRRRHRSQRKRPESENISRPLSKSLDDIDLINPNDLISDERNREDGTRRVIIPFGQLGAGLSIIGGRGNGLFIQSKRSTSRSLKTGDRIMQICGRSATNMTYAEAMELLNRFNSRGKQCLLQVKYDKEGYNKLDMFSRDNFYVRAKISHKSRFKPELGFEVGDIFHVTDTELTGNSDLINMWQVEKLDSRGLTIATGCIPISVDQVDFLSGIGSHSMPRLLSPRIQKMNSPMFTLQHSKVQGKQVSAESAFKIYQPIKKVAVTEPRPLVLVGVFDSELSEYLIENGSKDDLKFTFPSREPIEKMSGVSEDKIVESLNFCDGVMQSTVDDVLEVSKTGHHCVLNLSMSDLEKPIVSSLRPIIISLSPRPQCKTIRLKTVGGRLPSGFTQEVLFSANVNQIKDKIRRIQRFVTGELEVSSPVNVDELVSSLRDLVREQQRMIVWENYF